MYRVKAIRIYGKKRNCFELLRLRAQLQSELAAVGNQAQCNLWRWNLATCPVAHLSDVDPKFESETQPGLALAAARLLPEVTSQA